MYGISPIVWQFWTTVVSSFRRWMWLITKGQDVRIHGYLVFSFFSDFWKVSLINDSFFGPQTAVSTQLTCSLFMLTYVYRQSHQVTVCFPLKPPCNPRYKCYGVWISLVLIRDIVVFQTTKSHINFSIFIVQNTINTTHSNPRYSCFPPAEHWYINCSILIVQNTKHKKISLKL